MKKTLLAIVLAVATPLMFAAPQTTNTPAKTAKKKHSKKASKKGSSNSATPSK